MVVLTVFVHHGGFLNEENWTYVGGIVEKVGRVNTDYLTVPDLNGVVQGCGYRTSGLMFCTLDDEEPNHMRPLQRDADVITIIEIVEANQNKSLHIYVKHNVDVPEIVMDSYANGDADRENEVNVSDAEAAGSGDNNTGINDFANARVLSDFSGTDVEDPDLYDVEENQESVAKEAGDAAMKWFAPWAKGTSAAEGEGCVESDYGDSEASYSLDATSNEDMEEVTDPLEGEPRVRQRQKQFPQYKEAPDLRAPVTLEVGLMFNNCEQFKSALRTYAIQKGFEYELIKNDKVRVRAVCKERCGWGIYLGLTREKDSFQIKTHHAIHTCGSHHINKKASIKWLAQRYLENFRDDPTWPPSALRGEVAREYMIDVTTLTCSRARRMALRIIFGRYSEQYRHVPQYLAAILKWNPGSSGFLHREASFFQRMYICLGACKQGFLSGCRPIISVDACFLKGDFPGQLLAAIGTDGNDDMFPIAYAVCEAECRDSWTWFLTCLLEDIGGVEVGWTFMSDRQKGLQQSFEHLMPGTEHRMCIRHLHANFKDKGYKGKAWKDALWAAARASNKNEFNRAMEVIKGMDEEAHKYLALLDVRMWSRHAFNLYCKSDMLLNNLAETFNAWVKEARDKPILTMVEIIRRQMMMRFQTKRDGIKKSSNLICPKIVKKLERSKTEARNYICMWRSEMRFEVDHHYHPRRVVDLSARECGCGRWQLNGIPCPHAISAIYFNKGQPEDYVHECYLMATYAKAYAPEIFPMPGPHNWPEHEGLEILPPVYHKQPGRPRKNRKQAPHENEQNPSKLSQAGYVVSCGNCGAAGHNARRCPQPENPNKKKWPKRVRKPKQKNMLNDNMAADPTGEAGASHEGDEITNGAQPQRIRRTIRRRVGDGIAANVMSQTTEQHVKQPMVAPEGDQTEGVGHRQAIPEIRRRGRSNVVERAAEWAEMMRATQ